MKVGDKLIDNDPRMRGRRLTIVALGHMTVVGRHDVQAQDSMGNLRWYLCRRIHTDGKPRKSGFDLKVTL